ncbi:DUF7827 domain-containing protein [Haloarcula sediminis]|uniref:DUF7827 domain-containing protein n=1 Tax=Haloarcula sediminis TaxID=3111777 RepID=UPI002D7670E0|nr:BGTF surface domain-containing protein [Haloarcula sp. CK38]
MTSNSDKFRSLILAALMVFSVFAGTVALSGSAAAQSAGNVGTETYYGGQEVVLSTSIAGVSSGNDYEVRTVDTSGDSDRVGQLRRTVTAGESFDLDGRLSEGTFVIVPATSTNNPIDLDGDGNNSVTNDQFEVVTQDLTAEFEDDSVGNDGGDATVEYEIASDVRNDYKVNVSAEGLDAEDLVDIFEDDADVQIVDEDDDIVEINESGPSDTAETTYDLNFTDVDADTYTFEANVTDADASDSDEIEVTDTGDSEANFGDNVYADQRGDVVNISVEMSNTDEATLQVGEVDESGYSIIADVTDDDEDGVAYVEFNSFTAGNQSLQETTLTAGDDDTELDDRRNDSGSFNGNEPTGSDILDSGDYNLFVEAGFPGGNITESSDSRATLDLTDASIDNLQTWTAPEDSELFDADAEDVSAYSQAGNLTQADTVAEGDTVVVQVEASGLEGALQGETTDMYTQASASGDIFNLTFEGDSVPNQEDQSANIANLSSGSYSVLYDGENDAHYVVIDSAVLKDAGVLEYEDGDEYTANFTVSDENTDLVDDSVSVTGSFDIEDPEAELDTNADDEIVLEAAAGQEVTGDTNLAPGTDVELTLDSDTSGDPFVKRPEGTVQQDGTFTAVADFSQNNAGSEFTATIEDVSSADEYDGRLVEATGTPVTDTPDTDTDTPDMDTDTPDTDTPDMDTDTATATDTETADGGDDTATATGGSGPGFTAALALIALVAAALLAVRRNN